MLKTSEKHRASSRAYYHANKSRIQARRKTPEIAEAARIARRKWYKANREKVKQSRRAVQLKTLYGLSVAEYDAMMKVQRHRCMVCDRHADETAHKKLHVDHSHKTKKVRGLLCGPCNTTLGLVKEDPIVLGKLIRYLEYYT